MQKGERRKYYESLNMKNVLDSKEFWKTMRPFLYYKNIVFSQISMERNNRIMCDNFDLSEEFSTFFEDAVWSLNAKPDEYYPSENGRFKRPCRDCYEQV